MPVLDLLDQTNNFGQPDHFKHCQLCFALYSEPRGYLVRTVDIVAARDDDWEPERSMICAHQILGGTLHTHKTVLVNRSCRLHADIRSEGECKQVNAGKCQCELPATLVAAYGFVGASCAVSADTICEH